MNMAATVTATPMRTCLFISLALNAARLAPHIVRTHRAPRAVSDPMQAMICGKEKAPAQAGAL